jgi:hypothetical protein
MLRMRHGWLSGGLVGTAALLCLMFGCSSTGGGGSPDSGSDGPGTITDAPTSADTGSHDARATNDGPSHHDGGTHDSGADHHASADAGVDARESGAGDSASGDASHDGGASPLIVTPSSLAFGMAGGTAGFVACGTSGSAETLTVKNGTSAALSYWTSLGLGSSSPYTASPTCTQAAPCMIAAGQKVTVTVTPAAVPDNAGIASYNDVLTVFSSAPGDQGSPVQLSEQSYGAILQFSPSDENFGLQPTNGTYSEPIQILNLGNAGITGATLSLTGSSEFNDTGFSGDIPVSGGTFNAVFQPGTNESPASGTVVLHVPTNSTCAPVPSPLTLEGQGTMAVITATASLNFNTGQNGGAGVSCGTTGPTLNVVVKNSGTSDALITSLTLGLGSSSPFTVPAVGSGISVPMGSSVNVAVTPKTIPASTAAGADLDDVLTIVTNASGDTPHAVTLIETSAGVTLEVPWTSIVFSSTAENGKTTFPVPLINSGNLSASATLSSNNSVFTFDTGVMASADSVSTPNAYFVPVATSDYTGMATISVPVDTPVCGGFGGSLSLSLSGDGTSSNTYAVSPTAVSFGKNTCASPSAAGTAPAAVTVTLSNTSTAGAASYTVSITPSSNPFFSPSVSGGSIPAATENIFLQITDGTTSFTITPSALTSTTGLTALQAQYGAYAVVTVTIGTGTAAETFTLPVSEMPYGAFPVWATSSVGVTHGESAGFELLNASSAQTSFSFGISGASLALSGGTSGTATAGAPLTGTVSDTATGTTSGSITASLTSTSSALCGPLPAALPVSGN